MQQLPTTTLPSNERGATLIVALVMLILISLLGVSSLKNATVAEKMSAADHQKTITFQASESAAALAISDRDLIVQSIINDTPTTHGQNNLGTVGVGAAEAVVVLTPIGGSAPSGSSIAVGANSVTAQRIMITSTASLTADKRATAETVHGIVQLAPSSR